MQLQPEVISSPWGLCSVARRSTRVSGEGDLDPSSRIAPVQTPMSSWAVHCTNCWYRRSRSFCDTSVKVWCNDSVWHFLTRWTVSKMWGDIAANCVLQRKKNQTNKNKTIKQNKKKQRRLSPETNQLFPNEIIILKCEFPCYLCVILVFVHLKKRTFFYLKCILLF